MNKKKTKVLDFIISFIIIFLSGAVRFQYNNRIWLLLILFVLCAFILFDKNVSIKYDINIQFVGMLIICIFLTAFIRMINSKKLFLPVGDILRLIVSLLCYWILSDFEEFIKNYNRIISGLAVCSIIIWILLNIDLSWIKYFPTIHGYTDAEYYDLFIYVIPKSGTSKIRNYSMFWEPGAYQFFLNLSLYFEIIMNKKQNIFFTIIKVIALITTFSTTGYIIFLMIVFCKCLKEKKRSIKFVYFCGMIGIFFTIGLNNFIEKFSKKSFSYASLNRRMYDILCDIEIWTNNAMTFFIGVGQDKYNFVFADYLRKYGFATVRIQKEASSNGISLLLANYGIIFFVFLFYFFLYKTVRIGKKYNNIIVLIDILMFLIIIGTENFIFSVLVLVLCMYKNRYEKIRFKGKLDYIRSWCKKDNIY